MRKFTKKEDQYIKEHCLTVPAKRIARQMGRSEGTVRQRLQVLGITIPKRIRDRFRANNQYKKGQIPSNKGKKMDKELKKRIAHTFFKKGNTPANHRPLGSERISKEGYREIKIAEPNHWTALHRLVWEETFGAIPSGMVVGFVTGDKMNVQPWNLQLRTRAEHMARNTIQRYPPDVRKALIRIGRLKTLISKKQ